MSVSGLTEDTALPIRMSAASTELLLDLGHAVLEIRMLPDRDLVEQNGPLRTELNGLGLGRFS